MERGIARFTDFKLASNLGIGVAKGMVDLPKWHIDSEGEVRLAQNLLVQLLSRSAKSKQVLPFSVRGPLNDPVTKLETGKMPGRGITIPGIERLRRKRGVGAIINQVFPTKPPQAKPPPSVPPSTPPPQTTAPKEPPPLNTPPPATTPEKRPRPRDSIKNLLLKGLGG